MAKSEEAAKIKEEIENEVQDSYTKISVYEKKLSLDKYNVYYFLE